MAQPYYDYLGVTAAPITDGLLIPWSNEFMRGTIWAVSHDSAQRFDFEDYEVLSSLADFAAIIVRHQHQQKLIQQAVTERSVAELAHDLAHRINNPLQSLTNTVFLAQQQDANVSEHLAQIEQDLKRLSDQVAMLLNTTERYKALRKESIDT